MQQTLFETKSRDQRQEEAKIKWFQHKMKGCWVFPTGTGFKKILLKIIFCNIKINNYICI